MIRKLRSKAGFTLTETLLCVAILALLSAGGAAVSTAVLDTKNAMMENAHSQTLISTVLETVADELRFGQEITFKENKEEKTFEMTTFTSSTFGLNAEFELEDGYIVVVSSVKDSEDAHKIYELLPRSAYAGLKVTDFSIIYGNGTKAEPDGSGSASDDTFATVSITVEGTRGEYSRSVTVTMLNASSIHVQLPEKS